MGCNSSKTEDVMKDRQRIDRSAYQRARSDDPSMGIGIAGNAGGGTPHMDIRSSPLGVAGRSGDGPRSAAGEGGIYPGSFTNRKTKEYDFLHNIVQETRFNFIDVSARAAPLDLNDAQERSRKYGRIGSMSLAAAPDTGHPLGGLHAVFSFPASAQPEATSAQIADLVAGATVPPEAADFITTWAQSLSGAVDRIAVMDVGKVALSFEEL